MNGIKFKNNYLTKIIFTIKYSDIIKLSSNDKSNAEYFRKSVFKEFPNVSFKINNVTIPNNLDITSQKGELNWIFKNDKNNKTITLNSEYLILEYEKNTYIGFKNFLNDVILILNGLEQYFPFKYQSISLRYINQINENKINEENIKKYITLTNNFNLKTNEKLSQILTKLNTIEDNYLITSQYGFFNPKYPDPNFKKEYILDFECETNNILNNEEIIKELEKMNKIIYNKFDYAITDDFKKLMEVVK